MNAKPENAPAHSLPAGLAAPAQRALAGAGIESLEQMSRFSAVEIGQLHGIGPNALAQLRRALTENRLSFLGETAEQENLESRNESS